MILIWECEWKEMMNSDPEIISHLSEIEEELKLCKEPIDPRQALFGGRTEAISVYARADIIGGETIKAVDFTSLYPSVMKEKDFPILHPVVLRGSPEKFNYAKDEHFGLMHCKIIPPRSLFHPVLPTRIQTESGTKLVFSLCRSCSENLNYSSVCSHSAEERCFVGVWCTPEIYKAVEMGYMIEEIYEVWDYAGKSNDLFVKFVNTFLKIKQESSGFPSGCVTQEQKEAYIRDYFENKGILLDLDKIEKNPVLRLIAKLLLNSCWGFWARKRDKKKTNLTHKSDVFFKQITDDTLSDKSFRILNKDTVLISGIPEKQFVYPDQKGNVVHAAFVTSWARLKLYEELLQKLDESFVHGYR